VCGNGNILTALRETYRFVFLDEFQDTTTVQFALTKASFLGSSSILTAVGDTKQRIMGWAGALHGVFQSFHKSFDATIVKLAQNHRSRSKLVAVQSIFAAELDPESVSALASRPGDAAGECRVLEFGNQNREAEFLAELVEKVIISEPIPAEEICVLCRARPDSFAQALISALKQKGIKVRVDVNRRETLSEPVSAILLDIIALMFGDNQPEAWENVNAVMAELAGDHDEQEGARRMHQLVAFLAKQKMKMPPTTAGKEQIGQALHTCLNFLGRDRFAVLYPQYAQGGYLTEIVERLAEMISVELPDNNWIEVVNAVKGVGAVSIMTMHKSKGLEFHTVIFLGLEDNAIWNYQRNADEETCGLFVALSRAKERCIFTFCRGRPGRYGTPTVQTRFSIKRIFELFNDADVNVETIH